MIRDLCVFERRASPRIKTFEIQEEEEHSGHHPHLCTFEQNEKLFLSKIRNNGLQIVFALRGGGQNRNRHTRSCGCF